jgi:methylmalonyl-CoA mutase
MLKYHIQTSGRSLHSQDIAVQRHPHHPAGPVRHLRQLQQPAHQRLRRGHHHPHGRVGAPGHGHPADHQPGVGLAKNENPLQGSFVVEELTDLVEEAVLTEFDRITERGGVLGAMEPCTSAAKIQEESMYYEQLKHTGELPIIGVNTYLDPAGSPTVIPGEVIRSTPEEKEFAITTLEAFHARNAGEAGAALKELQRAAVEHENTFAALMEAAKVCSLGQISGALYEVGGQYRRNM